MPDLTSIETTEPVLGPLLYIIFATQLVDYNASDVSMVQTHTCTHTQQNFSEV